MSEAAIVLIAASAAAIPLPAWMVERLYAGAVYPRVQAVVTRASNAVPFALFDVIVAAFVAAIVVVAFVHLRQRRRRGMPAAAGRALLAAAALAATAYLWFLVAWGLNYARPPIEARLGAAATPVPAAAVRNLAVRAVAEVNTRYAAAHARGFAPLHSRPVPLVAALHEIGARLGRPSPTVPAVPKTTVFAPFFRASGTDGMLAPFALETLVNPDLTGPERAVLVGHEWAHLAGFAPEADASFVGVLATLRADVASQYSGWLFLVGETSRQVPGADAREIFKDLGPGPRADLAAIRERLERRVELVERVSWRTYDRYLKSQGVAEGVRSYSRVLELMLGAGRELWDSAPR